MKILEAKQKVYPNGDMLIYIHTDENFKDCIFDVDKNAIVLHTDITSEHFFKINGLDGASEKNPCYSIFYQMSYLTCIIYLKKMEITNVEVNDLTCNEIDFDEFIIL